jgi:hypothetical protein
MGCFGSSRGPTFGESLMNFSFFLKRQESGGIPVLLKR